MQVTEQGQVMIPRPLREKYGLTAMTEVEFVDTGEEILLRKAPLRPARLNDWARSVRGITKGKMSTDQIMQLTRGEES